MNKNHLRFLDFALVELSKAYPDGYAIHSLANEFKKKTNEQIEYEEQTYIEELYQHKYFEQIGTSFSVNILPEIKEVIDNYGSLSNYLNEKSNDQLSEDRIDSDLKNLHIENARLLNINLQLQNRHFKRYILYSIIGFLAGVISSNWRDIIELIK